MKLADLISQLPCSRLSGPANIEVSGIAMDSRQVRPGWLFVARLGNETDGRLYINDAIERGASGIILAEKEAALPKDIAIVEMDLTNDNISLIADVFYGRPKCKLIGITGTNGKTTTTYLTRYFLEMAGISTGLIGTVAYEFGERSIPASRTTPDVFELYRLLHNMNNDGAEVILMEVSSHALDQQRTGLLYFDAAVFTNLSRDHLDYHNTMEMYYAAKRKLFDKLKDDSDTETRIIISIDDQWGKKLFGELHEKEKKIITFSSKDETKATFHAHNFIASIYGSSFELIFEGRNVGEVKLSLIGKHNISNCLAAMAIARELGADLGEVIKQAAHLPAVPGRLEFIGNKLNSLIVVDYAHTDDALNNTLCCLKELNPKRLIVVFGCGGDRDKGKRARMGAIAEKLADKVIVTSDNPRTEDPDEIISGILDGMNNNNHYVEPDRRKAIYAGISDIQDGDILLIAGKGHETYQEINRVFHHFDDRETARDIITEIEKENV